MNQENTPKIETGIPIPLARHISGKWAPTLRKMQSGESFVAPFDAIASIRSVARQAKINVITRKIDATTYRIWRA